MLDRSDYRFAMSKMADYLFSKRKTIHLARTMLPIKVSLASSGINFIEYKMVESPLDDFPLSGELNLKNLYFEVNKEGAIETLTSGLIKELTDEEGFKHNSFKIAFFIVFSNNLLDNIKDINKSFLLFLNGISEKAESKRTKNISLQTQVEYSTLLLEFFARVRCMSPAKALKAFNKNYKVNKDKSTVAKDNLFICFENALSTFLPEEKPIYAKIGSSHLVWELFCKMFFTGEAINPLDLKSYQIAEEKLDEKSEDEQDQNI